MKKKKLLGNVQKNILIKRQDEKDLNEKTFLKRMKKRKQKFLMQI